MNCKLRRLESPQLNQRESGPRLASLHNRAAASHVLYLTFRFHGDDGLEMFGVATHAPAGPWKFAERTPRENVTTSAWTGVGWTAVSVIGTVYRSWK